MSQALKQKAKKQYSSANYVSALQIYQQASSIQQDLKKKSVIQMNIALCFFNLNLVQDYHVHLEQCLKNDPQNQKGRLHTIKYFILTDQFQIAKKMAQQKFITFQNEVNNLKQMMIRKQLAMTNNYQKTQNWIQIFNQAKVQFEYFHQSLTISKSKFGLGIFAAQNLPAWQIIIVQKPLAFLSNKQYEYSQDTLEMTKKVKKLMKLSKSFSEKFRSLSHKNNLHLSLQQRKKIQKLTDNQIRQIISTNWFQVQQLKQQFKGSNKYSIGAALYEKISFLNHSCEKNCEYFFIGQTMFVRTIKPILKNMEVFINYHHDKQELYRRQKLMGNWGIKCDCIYCVEQRKMDKGQVDPNNQKIFKSDQVKRNFIGSDIFFNGFQPHTRKYVLQNPQYRWIFLLKLKNEQKLKSQMIAKMFKCQKNQKQFQKMFQGEDDEMMKMMKGVNLSEYKHK